MNYSEPVFRPPAEAASLIVQLTEGCRFNRCRFCAMYKQKRFRVRTAEEVASHLDWLAGVTPPTARCFIGDGDALCLDTDRLRAVMTDIRRRFPAVRRFGVYGSPRQVLDKGPDDLKRLRAAGLAFIYLGYESGSEAVLAAMNKPCSFSEMVRSGRMVRDARIKLSATFIIGLGGKQKRAEHIDHSTALINAAVPAYTSLLALMPQGTPLRDDPEYNQAGYEEYVAELTGFVSGINGRTVFRANHASNALPLEGRFPRDRERLLAEISHAGRGLL